MSNKDARADNQAYFQITPSATPRDRWRTLFCDAAQPPELAWGPLINAGMLNPGPEPRVKRPARRLLQIARPAAVLAIVAGLSPLAKAQQAAPAGAPAPAVVTLTVHPQEITRASEFIGHVQAIQSVDVHAQVSGILQRVAFDGGQDVKQGALLYQIEPAQYQAALAAAQAQLQSAQANLVQAQQNLARQQSLFQHQTTPEATLEQAQAQRGIAQANVLAAQAQVQTAQINVGYTSINAPIAGRVGATKVTAGNLVGPTTGTLTTVAQLDPIRVVFSVNERALVAYKQAHAGASQEEINSRFVPKLRLPDGSMFSQSGRVAFVENQVDPNTGTLPVYADFPNPQDVLLPGMLVTAVVSPETPPVGFLVPAGAVGQDAQGKFVLVIGPDNKVERRNVDTNDQIEQSIAITKGLQDGDRVIVEGGQKVRPGQVVRPIAEGARAQGAAPSPNAQAPAQRTQASGGAPPTSTAQSPAPNASAGRPSVSPSGSNAQSGATVR